MAACMSRLCLGTFSLIALSLLSACTGIPPRQWRPARLCRSAAWAIARKAAARLARATRPSGRVILEVTETGTPALTSYRRVIIRN